MHYKLVKVKDVPHQKFRFCLIARVEKKENKLLVQDETGSLEIEHEENVMPGLYRVFLTKIGDKINIDILQSLRVEENLFKNVKEVYIGLDHD